jgi:hypothetical protein
MIQDTVRSRIETMNDDDACQYQVLDNLHMRVKRLKDHYHNPNQ